jgi:hypothetical protein
VFVSIGTQSTTTIDTGASFQTGVACTTRTFVGPSRSCIEFSNATIKTFWFTSTVLVLPFGAIGARNMFGWIGTGIIVVGAQWAFFTVARTAFGIFAEWALEREGMNGEAWIGGKQK